jgi:hypothetical protein
MDKNGILISLSESRRTDFGKEDFVAQSIPQKVFSSIWALESQVNNGGFEQYFVNFTDASEHFVAEALDRIGAPETAAICRRAIACAFPEGLPSSQEEISAAALELSDEVQEKLGKLDTEFFAYPHDLTELLFAYVSAHPEEFGPVP